MKVGEGRALEKGWLGSWAGKVQDAPHSAFVCALTSMCVYVYGEVVVVVVGCSICEIMCSYSPVECKKKEEGALLSFPVLRCFLFSLHCAVV